MLRINKKRVGSFAVSEVILEACSLVRAVFVFFFSLALRAKVRMWSLRDSFVDNHGILGAVFAPVPVVSSASLNVFHHRNSTSFFSSILIS